MRNLCTAIIILVFCASTGCANDSVGAGSAITLDMEANTIISASKLWLVTENGELVIRQPNWDPIARGYTEPTSIVVGGISGIKALSSQSDYSDLVYVIKEDGTVWQAIETGSTSQYGFEKTPDISDCVKICTGNGYAIALTSDGSVYAWGDNKYGQLGLGTTRKSKTPKKVKALSNIIDIACDIDHSMALNDNGKVYTWGNNDQGQLGDGEFTKRSDYGMGPIIMKNNNRRSPYLLESLSGIIQIAAGSGHSFALRGDGVVFEWGTGDDLSIFLYLEPDFKMKTPYEVKGLEQIVEISAYGIHAIALSSSGDIWRWGNVLAVPGEGWDTIPKKTAVFPNPEKIVAGKIDAVITKDGEIWQGFVEDEYYDGKAVRILSQEDIQKISS